MHLKWVSQRSSLIQGSQIFEAIGVSQDVIDKYFTGTVSRVGGITLEDIEDNVEKLHSEAFDPLGLDTDLTLDSVGAHKMRSRGEEHKYNPQTIHLLQESTRQVAMICLNSILHW